MQIPKKMRDGFLTIACSGFHIFLGGIKSLSHKFGNQEEKMMHMHQRILQLEQEINQLKAARPYAD